MNQKCNQMMVVFLLIFGFLGLSACQGINPALTPTATRLRTATTQPTREPSVTPTPTLMVIQPTITIWHSWDESQIPVLVQIQRDFRAMHPDVHFDVLYIPIDDLLPRFEVEVRRGRGPTILLGPAVWGPILYDAGLIADLDDKAMDELASTLNQPAVGAAIFKGKRIGLPYSMRGVVLFRNKGIIPTKADTLEELISESQFATHGEQIGAILERSFYFAGAHLEGIGGKLMEDDASPAFNDSYGLAWLDLLSTFELAGPTDYLTNQDFETFMQGRVGWIIDGTWNISDLAESIGPENLAIDPWPEYQDGHLSGYVQADNIYLSSGAKGEHLDASREFLHYFLSPEAQIQLTDIGLIPASKDVQVVNVSTGHLLNQASTALSGGTTYPILPEMEIYLTQMDIALKTYYGGAGAQGVLQSAADTIRDQINLFKPTETPTVTPLPE